MKRWAMVVAVMTAACGDNLEGPDPELERWCPVRDYDRCTELGGVLCVAGLCVVGDFSPDLEYPYCIERVEHQGMPTPDGTMYYEDELYELSSPLAQCPNALDL